MIALEIRYPGLGKQEQSMRPEIRPNAERNGMVDRFAFVKSQVQTTNW